MSLDTDIDLILADGEDTFSDGTTTVSTMLMQGDEVQGQSLDAAGVIVGVSYVLLRASQFPSLSTGAAVKVNGADYTVAQKMRIQDGKVLQVYLGSSGG